MLKIVIPTDKKRWVSLLIRLNWLIALLYYLVVPIFHNKAITQPLTAAGCIASTLIWVVALQHIRVSKLDLSLCLVCLAVLLMKFVVGQSYTVTDGWYAALAFINVLGLFLVFRDIEITQKDFDFIYYISVFLTLLFFVYSFSPLAYRMESEGKVHIVDALVMNLNNPNAAAMHLFGLFCIILMSIGKRRFKVFNIILCAITIYLIFRTECRSCMIAVIFVLVFYIFFRSAVLPKPVVIIGMLLPVVTLAVYLIMYYSDPSHAITFANKMLFSGRETIYIEVLNELRSPFTILFGAVRKEYFYNAHNAFLSVLSSIGVIGTISYTVLLIRRVLDVRQISPVATVCLLGLSIQACAESAMFVGSFPFNMFLMLFLVLGRYLERENDEPRLEEVE